MYKTIIGFIVGSFVGILILSASAHPPCYEEQQPKQVQCGYEQHVNPLTGKLEQVYICK